MIIKFIKKKFNLIKICAVFTTVCFVVSTLGANLYAIPLAENANQKYEDVFNKASSISAEYGKITASKDANSDITIINIQDLHCHPQTQRNISKIIAQIAEKYNLKEIYVEGGYGNIDLNWLTSIKDENIRKQVTEKLLEEGLLTGSEYYKLTSGNKDVELKGIDEENLHRENVKRLAWIIENQGKYKDVIKKVENEINILEKMYVNSRNERFNRDIEKYLTNKIDSRRFYRQLAKYVKDINANPDKYNNITAIRLEDYPNIVKFITLRKISKDIDVRKVTQQLQVVINELKNRLPYNIYTQLLKETENLSDSQKVVELVTSLCKKEGIDLQYKYKALNDFLQSNEINRELNTVELVYEERQLITEIRKALSYNNEEYEITFVSDFSRFFKDYLEYKLTDADWKYFESGYEQFRQLYAKYATVDRIKEVEKDFAELNKYYGINDIRNEVFVNNLLQDKHPDVIEQSKFREDEEILKGSKEVIIAVTGGFHSNALEDILQAKEVNTIVITPSIFEGIEKATKQYKGIIKEQSKEFQHQALAYRILSSLKDQEQKIYLYGALKSLLGDNINKLKEVLGEDVDLDSLEKELQNLQLSSDEQSQLKVSRTTQFLESVADAIINEPLFPKEGGKAVFVPNVNKIILKVSETLVDAGIFLSNGPIFAAEQRGLPYLKEIAPEIYSRMPAFIQEALVAQEYGIYEITAEESVRKDTGEEDFADEIVDKTAESKAAVEDETVDSSYLSEEEKAELLEQIRDEENSFSVDQDLVLSVFEKFIGYFIEDNKVDNLDEYYELFLRKLFSLQPEILQFLNDKMDGQSIKDLLYDYEAEVINKNLTYLLARYNKKLSSLTDFSRIVLLFENIEKLNSLSERDFDYFMNLPNQFFIYVWEKSENASQLEAKIAAGKKFYDKNIDTDLAKAYFANAEKLKDLGVLYHQKFTALNKEAQLFILENAKNTSNIEKILTFYEGMRLSSDFDSKRNEDFKDPKFKALVKYISSTEDRDFYNKLFFGNYNEDELRIIVDSIDDIDFIKNYIWKYEETYKNLFKNLVESHIKKVASENNHLALKLILNKEFNQILTESGIDNISDEDNIVARYYSAIAVSRLMYDGAEKEVVDYDFTDENFIELIKEVTDLYTEIMKEMSNIVLLDRDTQIYALCNSERIITKSIFVDGSKEFNRFNTDTLKEIMSYLNIPEDHLVEYRRVKDIEGSEDNVEKKKASERWLDSIKFFKMAYDKAKGYFVFMGHGEINRDGNLVVYSPKAKREDKGTYYIDNGEATGEDIEVITPEDMANALFELATRSDDPVDLRNITIDLSCCYSYLFARNVYDKLKQKFESENEKGSYPTIITAGGLETELGYTIFTGNYVSLKSGEGNLHQGIDKVLSLFQDGSVHALTLGMVGVSEYLFNYSNITMFTTFSDETLLKRIEETKKHISDFFKDSKGKAIDVESRIPGSRVTQETKVSNLPMFGVEASIFEEADKIAPLWEEPVYRAIPALVFTGLIVLATMFIPSTPVFLGLTLTNIVKLVIIGLFSYSQKTFVKAHVLTRKLELEGQNGNIGLTDIFLNNDLDFFKKTGEVIRVIKERVFVTFSSDIQRREFKVFYESNKDALKLREGLFFPTIFFTIPYALAMFFLNSFQVVEIAKAIAIATVVGIVLHYINNFVAKLIDKKGWLQRKQKDIDFQDIKRRIKHVKLLLENPQVKRDLSELKEGSFALKFALENKDSRRAEYLLDFEKIRIHFIDTLDKEKENTIAEIERIEKKKRITKRDREKIQALREKSSEYTRIRSELLNDTSKVEETIKKIDNLLSVFEEVDIILDMIENFKAENGNIRETRILERDFLDFAENTFMKELMSLYDGKVSGIHVNRIVSSSRIFGTKMYFGNNVRMMYKLMLSSILHDIGKNIIPKTILNKQGSFDDLERNIMEMHVVFGGLILRSSILKRLSYTAENHHFTKEGLPRSYSFKTKIDELLNSKDGKTKNLYSAIAYSLDGEYENIIAQIVAFLKELNPQLSFDSESQYPRNLDDIKNILKDMNIDLTESQQEKIDPLLQEIKRMENEKFIAKIVTLLDVYEAVSPKLSFDTERTYQFPRQIRDISNMLENIDMYIELTDSQKREVIILLTEIAQIDSEEDESKKQDLERNFIKKVLYDRSKSVVIKYIREQNYKNVRENAFKVIFTKSPKDIFKELGKTEEEFMKDFEKNPKEIIDKCMSLVDTSALEFDPEVVRVFLDFYFNFDDVKVNNTIIDNLNKKKENRFIVHIKDVLYSLYKLQRSVNRMLVRFTPVIASVEKPSSKEQPVQTVESEEQPIQTDFDKYFKDKQVIIQKVTTEGGTKRVVDFKLLEFSGTSVKQIFNRLPSYVSDGKYDDLGIIVEKDSLGNIISVKAKEGYEFSSLSIDGEPVGNEKNNLNFSLGQISAMLRDVKILDYDSPDIKEDEMDKYVAHIYLDDADVPLDADKDGYENALEKAIQEAISGNKLMIIHIFRKGFKTEDLTIGQIYGKYKQAYSLIQRDTLKKLPILSEITKLEGEVETDPYITFDFFLQELLKNHFGHGNSGLFEYPIACYISKNGSQMVTYDSSLNLYDGRSTSPISQKLKDKGISSRSVIESLLYDSSIQGDGQGRKSMGRSLFRNFEDSRNVIKKIGGYIFFKAEVTSKFDIEDEAQKEAAREYKKEQLRASVSSTTSASTENKESELYSFGTSDSKTSSSVSVASDEDWKIFWGIESILKPFGVKLGNYAHVWEEALFRYLPTVFILLGYMNPLVGLGIQVVFILAHPLGKWMAARMNWEKAKKEGKQVGEKAGVGDLFKQIGKDFSLLTPTLVLMLPYVGALLSLAINPALSLIITPAIFTFADVIVKWLTKKDSGGEVISIDKNLVIFITIVSLGSYIFLPLIPVIHPIVNTLINPIVITNAINAGYLHYEYNKRQENRSKLLSIFDIDDESFEGSELSDRARNRISSILGVFFDLKDFLGKKVAFKKEGETEQIIPFEKKALLQIRRQKTARDYFYEKKKYTVQYLLKDGCALYDSEGNQFDKVSRILYTRGEEVRIIYDDKKEMTLTNGKYTLKNMDGTEIEFKVDENFITTEQDAFNNLGEIGAQMDPTNEYVLKEGCFLYYGKGNQIVDDNGKKFVVRKIRYNPDDKIVDFINNDGDVLDVKDGTYKLIDNNGKEEVFIVRNKQILSNTEKGNVLKRRDVLRRIRNVSKEIIKRNEEEYNIEKYDLYFGGNKIKSIRYLSKEKGNNGKLTFIVVHNNREMEMEIQDDDKKDLFITTKDGEQKIKFKFSYGELKKIYSRSVQPVNLNGLFQEVDVSDISEDVKNNISKNTLCTLVAEAGERFFLKDGNGNIFDIKGFRYKTGEEIEFIGEDDNVVKLIATGNVTLTKIDKDGIEKEVLRFDYGSKKIETKESKRISTDDWAQNYVSNKKELYYELGEKVYLSYIEGNEEKRMNNFIISYNADDGTVRFFEVKEINGQNKKGREIIIPEQGIFKIEDDGKEKTVMQLKNQNGKVRITREFFADESKWLEGFSTKPRTIVKTSYTPKEGYEFVGNTETEFYTDEDVEVNLQMIMIDKNKRKKGEQIEVKIKYETPKEEEEKKGASTNITIEDKNEQKEQKDFMIELKKELEKTISDLLEVSFSYNEQDGKTYLNFKFQDKNGKFEERSVECDVGDTSMKYVRYKSFVISVNDYFIALYDVGNENIDTENMDDPMLFMFKDAENVLYADIIRGYKLDDFADRKFIIDIEKDSEGSVQHVRHMLYFDSKKGELYKITNIFTRTPIDIKDKEELKKYGIIKFVPEGNGSDGYKIKELVLDEDVNMKIDVRQPIGFDKNRIQNEAKQLAHSLTSVPRPVFVLKPKELEKLGFSSIPKDFIKTFFENVIKDNKDIGTVEKEKIIKNIMTFIDQKIGDTISPEDLEQIFKSSGIPEKEAKMYVESILAEYIYTIVENLDNDKKREMILSVFRGDRNSLTELIDLYSSSAGLMQKFLEKEFGLVIDEKALEGVKITEQYLIKKLIEQNILQVLTPYQAKRAFERVGLNEKQIGDINFDSEQPLKDAIKKNDSIKKILYENNYQGLVDINLDEINFDIDFSDKDQVKQLKQDFKDNPIIYSMFVEALFRTFDSLQVQGKIGKDFDSKTMTLAQLLKAMGDAEIDKEYFETQLRGIFGEVYCTKKIVAGSFDGFVFRLQMAESANEPGIDLINPITGLKLQVKTGLKKELYLITEHFNKNWQEEPYLASEEEEFGPLGPRMIPVLTVSPIKEEADDVYESSDTEEINGDKDPRVQSFGIEGETIRALIKCLLNYDSEGEILTESEMAKRLNEILKGIDDPLSLDLTQSELQKILEEKQIEIQKEAQQVIQKESKDEQNTDFDSTGTYGSAILPENIGNVNTMLQQGKNALRVAAWVALQEADFSLSMEKDENGEYAFVSAHGDNTSGAIELMRFIENWKNKTRWLNRIAPRLARMIVRQASIVKHIAIDYRYIKASGIQEAINMFGKDARLTEDGQIEVAIVEDIEQLQNSFTLVNTGLKVDGASIYRIKNTDLLMFGAKGQQSIKIVQTINGTEQLKKSVMEMLKSSGQQIDDIETQGIVTKQGEGIEVKEGIIEIGEMELKGKTSQQIKGFITSSLEINRATGIMYGQKTVIGLEYIGASDINKLKSAIENGRARKVITKEQYVALRADMNENKENGFNEYLLELRKNGTEIYIDAREQVIEQKEIEDGIAGQIVTENGELYIQDYYSLEQTKLLKVDSEMLKERSLEQIILSESETIFVGIEILLEQFRQSNINVVQREFGALLGKIKLSLNIGELNFKDIESILYNIDYNKIPKLELAPSKNLQEYTKEDINAMIDSLILNMEETSEISIILKAIRKNKNFNEQDYDAFVQVIKERILAKTALIKGYKEYGLKDKRLEKLLGQLLFKQLDFNLEDKDPKEEKNFDFTYIDKDEQIRVVNGDKEKSEDNKEAEYVFMRKIVQDTEKARRGDKIAINSIIDIILTYGDEYKEKQLARDMDKNDIRNYRAMMSAA